MEQWKLKKSVRKYSKFGLGNTIILCQERDKSRPYTVAASFMSCALRVYELFGSIMGTIVVGA